MNTLAGVIVILAGIWLIGLAAAAFTKPGRMKQFFDKFASSAFNHFFEMFVRIIVGTAFVIYSPQMRFPIGFAVFGWLLILTGVVLLFVPWKMHRRFAARALRLVTKRMVLFGFVSAIGGIFILFSSLPGLTHQ